jgi:hypothetical protein
MDEPLNRFPGGIVAPQQWLDLLVPKLPNVPNDMIKHEILSVLRDFCIAGGAWRDWLAPVEIDGLAYEYGLPTGNPHAETTAVLRMLRRDDQWPLDPVPPEAASPPEFIGIGGQPRRYWQTQPDRFYVEPIPATGEGPYHVVPYVSMAPLDLCGIPNWFLGQYQLAIVDGVLASILRTAGPNYRPKDADRHRALYVSARNSSRTRSIAGYNRGTLLTRSPYLARGSQR